MRNTHHALAAALAFTTWACDEQVGSVGYDDCIGEKTRCEVVVQTTLSPDHPDNTVHTKQLETLKPTWIRSLPAARFGQLFPGNYLLPWHLVSSKSRDLWMVRTSEDGKSVHIASYDAEGKQLDERDVTIEGLSFPKAAAGQPYTGTAADAHAGVLVYRNQPNLGPTLNIEWMLPCKGGYCSLQQIIAFGDDLHQPTVNFLIPPFGQWALNRDSWFQAEGGAWSTGLSLQKRDQNGELVIQQNHVASTNPSMPLPDWRIGSQPLVVYPSGELQVIEPQLDVLYRVDREGNVIASQVGVGVAREEAALTTDSQGRLIIVSTTPEGDLFIDRADTKNNVVFDRNRFIRESYTMLSARSGSTDAADNVYVLTSVGDRGQDVPTLCGVSASGQGKCVLAPELTGGDIVAREAGAIYTLVSDVDYFPRRSSEEPLALISASEIRLARFDFPW